MHREILAQKDHNGYSVLVYGLPDIPVADSIYGQANGIAVLAQRRRDREIPGFFIPQDLFAEATGKPYEYFYGLWLKHVAPQLAKDSGSPENGAGNELGHLQEIFSPHGKIDIEHKLPMKESTDRPAAETFHQDAQPTEFTFHLQHGIVEKSVRPVFFALTRPTDTGIDFIEEWILAGLSNEAIGDKLLEIVREHNGENYRSEPVINAGDTRQGNVAVFSNHPNHPTAHLFRGNGGYTRLTVPLGGKVIRPPVASGQTLN